MRSIKRIDIESANDKILEHLNQKDIAQKRCTLSVGLSNTVKNVVGKDVENLPNLIGNDITLSKIFKR